MEEHIVKIRSIEKITHDVLRIVMEKPAGYTFTPGQATEVAINKPQWREERRPFTFTCLPEDDYLEMTIKTYPSRKGVTNELLTLSAGDELILHDVWGAIAYRGEGVFIAGGAGITPFLSIFRSLSRKGIIGGNKLIFANKTRADIIHEAELRKLLGSGFINILSDESVVPYAHGYLTEEFLKKQVSDFTVPFYLCGPPPMMDAVTGFLNKLGVGGNSLVVEV